MRALIQRVSRASVTVDEVITGKIENGLLILLGVTHGDDQSDIDYLIDKVMNLRIFEDDAGKMNLSLLQTHKSALVVSQFTLYADTRKGRRPSFTQAAPPAVANSLYESFCKQSAEQGVSIQKGIFGGDMKVELLNDGPVTIMIDSKSR